MKCRVGVFSFVCVVIGLLACDARAQMLELSRSFRIGPNPRDIVAADLNGDNWPEIITADTGVLADGREERPANDELSLLMAQGNLEYVKHHPSLKTGFAPYGIAVANIDELKMPDIVVVSFLEVRHRDITLYRNLPDGLFETIDFRVPDEGLTYCRHLDGDSQPIFTKPGLTSLVIDDLNGDGYRDIVTTAWSCDALVFVPGDPKPKVYFGPPKYFMAPGGPRDVKLADFDKDGLKDLAVVYHTTGEIGLWRGDGQGNFQEVTRFPTRGRLPNDLQVADMDSDGIPDLIVSHQHTDDSVVVFYGDGGFEFSVSQEVLLGEQRNVLEKEIRDMIVEDLTGDGRPEIAAACFASSEVAVLINQGSSGAKAQQFRTEAYTIKEGRPRAVCAADFNQDKKRDLAVALWEPDTVLLMLQR